MDHLQPEPGRPAPVSGSDIPGRTGTDLPRNPDPGVYLWHGGIPGLRPGDFITPGHHRHLDNCPVCDARAQGEPNAIDPPTGDPDSVYLTTDRLYARFYASMARRGDLYRVEPQGELAISTEDRFPTWRAPAAVVVSVFERAVLLTPSERRRLSRRWIEADAKADGWSDLLDNMSAADRRRFENDEFTRMVRNATRAVRPASR